MYGFNFIIRKTMRVSFFIDKNDELYHWGFILGFNRDFNDFEKELINDFGKDWLIRTVKSMAVYETRKLTETVDLVRFE
ncbi:hypothetical protein [uncultured Methanobrevibacter sp.]|uniref:hypothetical protein n=1 Tax=uncultured Methanobrevibacter sp. TaxID=253161 RepID=UPI0025D8C461|nr:hypothetical protein [uncultured Methanobrevibacter sp.]